MMGIAGWTLNVFIDCTKSSRMMMTERNLNEIFILIRKGIERKLEFLITENLLHVLSGV